MIMRQMPIKTCNEIVKQSATRMHSSSIRTTRFNGHLYEGVSALVGCVQGVPWTQRYTPPLPDRQTPLPIACWDTHPLWKEWQTGVKILPWPKLHLRAVNMWEHNVGINAIIGNFVCSWKCRMVERSDLSRDFRSKWTRNRRLKIYLWRQETKKKLVPSEFITNRRCLSAKFVCRVKEVTGFSIS